jgi:hypothetical protein
VLEDSQSSEPKITGSMGASNTSGDICNKFIYKVYVNTFHTGRKKLREIFKASKGINTVRDGVVNNNDICQKIANKSHT